MMYNVPYLNHVSILGKKLKPFEFWGIIGLASAICFSLVLSNFFNLSALIILILVLLAVSTFNLFNFFSFKLKGRRELVLYHQTFLIFIIHFLFLDFLEIPKAAYLDISIFGISVFLIFGRIGCFFSGCCHGKPSRKGVVYQINHLSSGFPRSYLGIQLFPIQLLESLLILIGLVLFISIRIWSGVEGSFMQTMLMWYFILRFILEFFRGDVSRNYFFSLSHSQWISFTLAVALFLLTHPSSFWIKSFHVFGLAGMSIGVFMAILLFFLTQKDIEKFYPEHLAELTETIRHFQPDRVYKTSKNMGISFAVVLQKDEKKIILSLSNFNSKAFGVWISDILANFIYGQIGEIPYRLKTKSGVFQYINLKSDN